MGGSFIQSSLLPGRAEDRGVEPLRLLPAVQRFAGVPSTQTGNVLRSRACDEEGLRCRSAKVVTGDTTLRFLFDPVPKPEWMSSRPV
jgi:hypothetical protein